MMGGIMGSKLNWGIIGAGYIVRKFAEGLSVIEDARIYGVSSRNKEHAERFASEIQVYEEDKIKVYDTPEHMVNDPAIDIVYIGVINTAHLSMVKLSLNHGKHVLCEKPFMMNAKETMEVIALAKQKNLFLMEAMWSKFTPAIIKVKEIIESGRLGKVTHIKASFGWHEPVIDGKNRLFDLEKGGGVLLDASVYPMSFAMNFMGRKPDDVYAFCTIGLTGADEINDIEFIYHEKNQLGRKQDVLCHLEAATRSLLGEEGRISFEYGEIYIPVHWAPQSFQITYPANDNDLFERTYINIQGTETKKALKPFQKSDYITETIQCPFQKNGYEYEAREVMRCIRSGEKESPIHTLQTTLDMMNILDEVRRQFQAANDGRKSD